MTSNLITRITDPFFFTYELLIRNRKLIFPTIVGLIIALIIISESSILVESYRQEIFEETVFSEHQKYTGDVYIGLHEDRADNISAYLTNYPIYNQLLNTSIIKADYKDYIANYWWYSVLELSLWVNETNNEIKNWINVYSSSSQGFFDKIQQILTQKNSGRIPENQSEVLLIKPKETGIADSMKEEEKKYENLTLNAEFNLTDPIYGSDSPNINKTVKIVGILEYPVTDYYYEFSMMEEDEVTLLIRSYLSPWFYYNYFLLTTPTILQEITLDFTNQDPNIRLWGRLEGKIFLDHSKFDAYNLNKETAKLLKFIQTLEIEFYDVTYYPSITSDLFWEFQIYQSYILGLIVILLLVSFPVLCIALYLVIYSFGLIRKQKMDQIGIIKTRGGSKLQVFFILLGEMIISILIAVVVGFLISTTLAEIVLRSSNYLQFLGEAVPIKATLNMFQNLIIWGILLGFLLNFIRIVQMSREAIVETLVPTETRDPIWKRYYLDVIIFIVGTGIWIIYMNVMRASFSGNVEPSPLIYIFYPLISLLFIPAPFFMFFGTIMVIARTFPFLMKKFADFLWKVEGGVNAFAIRNIVRHKQAANRAVLLITLALSFSILASSLIFSLDETERFKYFYEYGADITINEDNIFNNTLINILQENITHLTSVSTLYSAIYNPGGWRERFGFLFVDPKTYGVTAFNDPHFKLSKPLSNLMNELMDNETILLFEGNIKSDISKPTIGGNFSITFSNETINEIKSYRIGGSFKYWPTLYPYDYLDHSRYYWIVGSIGIFEQLNQNNYFSTISARYLSKIDSFENLEETIESISNVTSLEVNSPAMKYQQYKTAFGRKFTLSILNTDLIVCSAVSVIGVIMFAFFTYVERGKEIGVERALGMTRLQTAQSFLVEATTILTFGTIIGYATGLYFVAMFLQITQFGETIPPQIVTHPVVLIGQMLFGILVIAGLGTITPAYLASRKDISRILKVE